MHVHVAHHTRQARHHASAEGYSPPSASIVIDGNSGAVLEQSNPDALRHPASLTKVMTLYLLFERLEAGKIRLDTPLKVSEHAAEQAPTKLGLKPGQTIAVEDAIKAVVTRSANDVAVVIAENLGGSEEAFAELMTQKAHALGMRHTTYVNASGLPDDDQITSARDQALLGRVVQDRFPRYYRFFSTTAFVFHGRTIRGHNHLLGSVAGVDGIKTGFTRASGFNLITSVHRDGRFIVGVVLGGRSAFERDAHMRALVDANIRLASARRTAPVLAERSEAPHEVQAVAPAKAPVRAVAVMAAKTVAKITVAKAAVPVRADPTPTATASPRIAVGSSDPIRPLLVKTISYHTVTVRSGSMKPMPVLVPVADATRPVSALQGEDAREQALPVAAPHTVIASAGPTQAMTSAPSKAEHAPIGPRKPEPAKSPASSIPAAPRQAHNGWVIQIGAFDGEQEARQHLSEARIKLHAALAAADPFTERVQKGDKALFRARFAGFDKATAEAACRQLKRNEFACMALKD